MDMRQENIFPAPFVKSIKYWLDSSESNRCKSVNKLSMFQTVLCFVAVGILTCLESIFF